MKRTKYFIFFFIVNLFHLINLVLSWNSIVQSSSVNHHRYSPYELNINGQTISYSPSSARRIDQSDLNQAEVKTQQQVPLHTKTDHSFESPPLSQMPTFDDYPSPNYGHFIPNIPIERPERRPKYVPSHHHDHHHDHHHHYDQVDPYHGHQPMFPVKPYGNPYDGMNYHNNFYNSIEPFGGHKDRKECHCVPVDQCKNSNNNIYTNRHGISIPFPSSTPEIPYPMMKDENSYFYANRKGNYYDDGESSKGQRRTTTATVEDEQIAKDSNSTKVSIQKKIMG